MSGTSKPKCDLLIYAGAGDGEAVGPLLAEARRIVLIEADCVGVEALKKRFAQRGDVEIVEAALGNGSGSALFQRYNVSKANSFRAPKALANLYAGIQAGSMTEIDKIDASDLILSLISVADTNVSLIIDVNGDEGDILDSLEKGEACGVIRQITIQCGANPLFDGALTAQAAADRLEQLGYVDVETFGAGHFRRVRGLLPHTGANTTSTVSDLLHEGSRLRNDLDSATAQAEALKGELEALRIFHEEQRLTSLSEINRLVAELRDANIAKNEFEELLAMAHSEKAAEAKALAVARADNKSLSASVEATQRAVETQTAELEEQIQRAERDRDAALEREEQGARSYQSDLDAVTGDLQRAERDRDAALEREKEALSVHQAEAEALRERLAAAERDRDTALEREEQAARSYQSDLDAVTGDLQRAERDRDAALEREEQTARKHEELQVQHARAQEEAARAREDVAVATRLQALSQNDIRCLQEKYGDLLIEKERLDDLLARLNSRLTEASAYLELVDEENLEHDSLLVIDASESEADLGADGSARTGSEVKKGVPTSRSTKLRKRS